MTSTQIFFTCLFPPRETLPPNHLIPRVLIIIFTTSTYLYGSDDEIIGTKSTAIKFKDNIKFFVSTCYCLFVFFILILLFMMEISKINLILVALFILSLVYQIKIFNIKSPESCLKAFKNNNEKCEILNKQILTKSSYNSKSSGYSFGSTFKNNKRPAWECVESVVHLLDNCDGAEYSKKHYNWISICWYLDNSFY